MQTDGASVIDDQRKDVTCMQSLALLAGLRRLRVREGIRLPHLVRKRDAERIELIALALVEDVLVILNFQAKGHVLWRLQAIPAHARDHEWGISGGKDV